MRRREKEITDMAAIENVIRQCKVCRIGLFDNNSPYIVPMSFGYKDKAIYLHSAPEGRKITLLKLNPEVCFEFDTLVEVLSSDQACKWGMAYQSIVGFGTASFIGDPEEKKTALNIIMDHYSGQSFQFPDSSLRNTAVIKITISHITGKQSG